MITVERFNDPHYSRPRYRLRDSKTGKAWASYKFKRDAAYRADESNVGYFATIAMHDGRYTFTPERNAETLALQYAVRFCGERIATAPDLTAAYQTAGEHIADRRGVAKDNPNRRPQA